MKKQIFSTDFALLILRLGIGTMMILHGFPKIKGGEEMWVKLGDAMKHVGLGFTPAFWGFMAAFGEFGGGIFVALGLFTRPMAALPFITMMVAAIMHWVEDGFMDGSHAFELSFVFLFFVLAGAGKFSCDYFFWGKKMQEAGIRN